MRPTGYRAHAVSCVVLSALGCADLMGADFDKAHVVPVAAAGSAGRSHGGTSGAPPMNAGRQAGGAAGARPESSSGAAGSQAGRPGQTSGSRDAAGHGGQSAGEAPRPRDPVPSGGAAGEADQVGGAGAAGSGGADPGSRGDAGSTDANDPGADGGSDTIEPDVLETLDFTATDVAVASRDAGSLDLFAVEDGRLVWHPYDGAWHSARYLEGADASIPVPAFTSVAADFAGTRLDVFALGSDGLLYYYYANTTDGELVWTGPSSFDGAGLVRVNSGIGATSMAMARFDVFAITPAGVLGHVFGDEYTATAEDWDWPWLYLVPLSPVAWASGLQVVSPWPTRLDVFFLSLSGRSFQHHWYDQTDDSYWGPDDAPQREEITLDAAVLRGGGIDALAAAATYQGVTVFLRVAAEKPRLYRTIYHQGTWNASSPSGTQPSEIRLASCPERLFGAISRNGLAVDLFGGDADHHVWHASLH